LNDANAALEVFAVAPHALGGVRLRCGAGPERDAWVAALRRLLPAAIPWRRLPVQIRDEALLGGLDLAATLAAGKPVAERGLLAQAAGGIVVAAMAERMSVALAARLCAALDEDTSIAVVALDEGAADDEAPPPALLDRLAFFVEPDALPIDVDANRIDPARELWRSVRASDALIEALVAAAAALGVASARASWQALCVARISAALDGRNDLQAEDAALAARLVLAPRATRAPQANAESAPEPPPPNADNDAADSDDDQSIDVDRPLDDRVIAAALAAIPPGLLALLAAGRTAGPRRGDAGRMGQNTASRQRGRVIGAVRGEPRGGARLALIETLRAAAPWQKVRRAQNTAVRPEVSKGLALASIPQPDPSTGSGRAGVHPSVPQGDPSTGSGRADVHPSIPQGDPSTGSGRADVHPSIPQGERGGGSAQRVHVTRDDLRVQRRVQRRATTTIFAIDASGSQALHRLAEAKGAVELLLADCYARRDRVAVIGFRGTGAQVLLAPTRSLVRAKRQLAGLPGGGGTPLAAAIDAVQTMAAAVRRGGATPLVVLLTDGRANIARDGAPGREAASRDALNAARAFAQSATAALLIDTSPQPSAAAQAVAAALGARCIALPHAQAQALSQAVRNERGSG
jgi:magnesium chelatase subunit D